MRLNPTTILTPHDWLVDVVYVGWHGREVRRTIGVTPKGNDEAQALLKALNSLKKRGELPPKILDMKARRRHTVGIEKTINRELELVQRFVSKE